MSANPQVGHVPPNVIWCRYDGDMAKRRARLKLAGRETTDAAVVLDAVRGIETALKGVSRDIHDLRESITGTLEGSPGLNGRVKALEESVGDLRDRLTVTSSRAEKLTTRVIALERWRSGIVMVGALIGGALALIVRLL